MLLVILGAGASNDSVLRPDDLLPLGSNGSGPPRTRHVRVDERQLFDAVDVEQGVKGVACVGQAPHRQPNIERRAEMPVA
jgi:hypothetical protein